LYGTAFMSLQRMTFSTTSAGSLGRFAPHSNRESQPFSPTAFLHACMVSFKLLIMLACNHGIM
jgi:hypothetical protein